MKIEVRPIQRKTWHGKTGKDDFTCEKVIQALVNPDTMEYATGLSDKDIQWLTNTKGISYDLSPIYTPDKPHPFWDSKQGEVRLENRTMIFDMDKPMDFIKVHIMRASKYVANSMQEFNQGLYPEASHVIFDEMMDIEEKATKVTMRNKAVLECSKLSRDKKGQIVMILSGKSMKGQSDNMLEVKLAEVIEEQPEEVLELLSESKEDLTLRALVLECLQKNVLQKRNFKIWYLDQVLGNTVSEVVNGLKDIENNDLKVRLMAAVN